METPDKAQDAAPTEENDAAAAAGQNPAPAAGQSPPDGVSYSPEEMERIAEAVLFAMGKSVDAAQLAAALNSDRRTAVKTVERLMARYEEEHRGMRVIRLDDRYQMCAAKEYYEPLIRVVKAPKKPVLTDVLLETLSIVAYRQPVTRLEIEKIRGVKSDHAVNKLIEYDLIYEAGRLDAPGRPALFATTEEFLRRFGIPGAANLPQLSGDKAEELRLEAAREVKLDEPREEQAAGAGDAGPGEAGKGGTHEDPGKIPG